MKISVKKISICLFYIFYASLLLFSFSGHIPIIGKYTKLISNLAMCGIFINIILDYKNYTKNELLGIVVVSFFAFIYALVNQDFTFLKLLLVLISSKNVSFEKRIKFDLYLRLVLFSFVFVLYKIGVAPNLLFWKNGTAIFSYGFTNPNVIAMHSLILLFDTLYLFHRKKGNKKYILFYIFNIIIFLISYKYCYSRTYFIIYIVALILFFIYDLFPKVYDSKLIQKIFVVSPYVVSVLVLILSGLFSAANSFTIMFNEFTSQRLSNIIYYMNNYGISFFGHNISNSAIAIDTTCAYFLFAFGVVGLLVFMIFYSKLISKLFRIKKVCLSIIFFAFILYGIGERLWTSVDYNIYVSAFSLLIFTNKGDDKDDK